MNCSLVSSRTLTAYALALFSFSQSALACSSEPYVGAVCFTAASFCPRGYLEANGQTIPVQQSQALYSLITRLYTPSSTANTSFNLPDMRGRSPVGAGIGPNNSVLSLGQTRGAETAVMSISQMPIHSHQATLGTGAFSISATTAPGVSNTPSATNNQLAATQNPGTSIYAPAGGTQVPLAGVTMSMAGATATVNNTGAATPINTLSPQIALRACIAVQGYYPPRS